ncbi:GtrA family protein [Arachidicoccus sp.]|uniref:GtrA family protein n=1 Tax=Arachidicoccus sp. TaxID=1872624 RepID=UPI003D1BB3BD
MLKLHYKIKKTILSVIDFFYPLFRRIFPLQTFRYAVCGGGNLLLNFVLFAAFFHLIYQKQLVYLPFGLVLTPTIASYISAFCFTFPIGFYLNLFVVFPGSNLKRRIQLARYLLIVCCNFFFNYILLSLFVHVFHWYPTPSYILEATLVVTFTYFSQRYFTFRQQRIKD